MRPDRCRRPGIRRAAGRILSGRYGFGDKLGEIEIADELGLSRTPVREALRRSGSEGLLEVLPNRRALVGTWTAQDLGEADELRAVLEGLAARRAAARAEPATLAELDRLAATMVTVDPSLGRRPAGDFSELAALNARFHELIVTAAGSAQLGDHAAGSRATAAGHAHVPALHGGRAGP